MNKRTVRQFSSLMWRANSPAEYELVGYPNIKGVFDGDHWRMAKVEMAFTGMEQLSQVLEQVIANFNDRGGKW